MVTTTRHEPGRYTSAAWAYMMIALAVFVALAFAVHKAPYFRIDLAITRFIQSYHGGLFDRLMTDLSWIGYPPQVEIIALVCLAMLYLRRRRWEAGAGLFALAGAAIGILVKIVVHRPRPGVDLIHVVKQLTSAGFPSGHVLTMTSFGGYLVFLCVVLRRRHWTRTALITLLLLLIPAMGLSRIYLGEHWFSDVIGGYLLGTFWLALTIKFYWWGRERRQKEAGP